jgi:hypothetical protein
MPVALLDEVALSLVFHRSGQIPQDLPMSGGSPSSSHRITPSTSGHEVVRTLYSRSFGKTFR